MRDITAIAQYIQRRNLAEISRDTGIAHQTIKKVQDGSGRVLYDILITLDHWMDEDIYRSLGIKNLPG